MLFLDLLELSDATAEVITSSLLSCMFSYGFSECYLLRNLVGFALQVIEQALFLAENLMLAEGY